ncbi:hypothetical protein Hdeb2414_s0001g00025071 [Helianthus debilis subsp. tardiflorus]
MVSLFSHVFASQFEVELLEMQIPLQRDYKESDEKHGIFRKRLKSQTWLLIKELVKEKDEEKKKVK